MENKIFFRNGFGQGRKWCRWQGVDRISILFACFVIFYGSAETWRTGCDINNLILFIKVPYLRLQNLVYIF